MKLVCNNLEINIENAQRPKFRSHRGRTWDSLTAYVNNKKTNFHFDSTWGYNFYFEVYGKWYSVPIIDNYDNIARGYKFSLERGKLEG